MIDPLDLELGTCDHFFSASTANFFSGWRSTQSLFSHSCSFIIIKNAYRQTHFFRKRMSNGFVKSTWPDGHYKPCTWNILMVFTLQVFTRYRFLLCPNFSIWQHIHIKAVLRLHGFLNITRFILVLSFLHLVINHSSAYTAVFPKSQKQRKQRTLCICSALLYHKLVSLRLICQTPEINNTQTWSI